MKLAQTLYALCITLCLTSTAFATTYDNSDFAIHLPRGMHYFTDKGLEASPDQHSKNYVFVNKPDKQAISIVVIDMEQPILDARAAALDAITGAVEGLRSRTNLPPLRTLRDDISAQMQTITIHQQPYQHFEVKLPDSKAQLFATVKLNKLLLMTVVAPESSSKPQLAQQLARSIASLQLH